MLFVIAKILNLKGYHNDSVLTDMNTELFVIAKILNLKGYHNFITEGHSLYYAVCDSKDTEFERISQR